METNADQGRAVFVDCTADLEELLTPDLRALVPGLEVCVGAPADEAELIRRLGAAPAAMVFMAYLSEAVLAACPALRAVVYLATGLTTHVDLATAERLNIRVRNVKGYGDLAVAEHTIALMFAAARRLAEMDRELRQGTWHMRRGVELAGRTLGIVGLGGNGRAVVHLAAALGMPVVAWNRSGVPAGLPCEAAELDEVLGRADIVSLHLELNDQTRGILDRRRLGRLKPGAILVNTARFALIEEAPLIEAVAAGRIAHLALDVFPEEPLPRDHALARLPNTTLTAHVAWYTREASMRLLRIGLQALSDELAALA